MERRKSVRGVWEKGDKEKVKKRLNEVGTEVERCMKRRHERTMGICKMVR